MYSSFVREDRGKIVQLYEEKIALYERMLKKKDEIFHPILGSRPHGRNKQNKLWLEHFDLKGMMLHAHQLIFNHPIHKEQLILNAKINEKFSRVGTTLNLDLSKYK